MCELYYLSISVRFLNWSPSTMLPRVNKVTKTEIHASQSLTIVAVPIFHEVNAFFFVYDLYYDVIRITDLWN
jgi:hypothetical protein